jgi:hypothetical protein
MKIAEKMKTLMTYWMRKRVSFINDFNTFDQSSIHVLNNIAPRKCWLVNLAFRALILASKQAFAPSTSSNT